jgi:hypothetical protein
LKFSFASSQEGQKNISPGHPVQDMEIAKFFLASAKYIWGSWVSMTMQEFQRPPLAPKTRTSPFLLENTEKETKEHDNVKQSFLSESHGFFYCHSQFRL